MKGRELSKVRGEIGATREELADLADLTPEILNEWERFDLEIPRESAQRLEWAIWMLQQQRVLAGSGLPECEWMRTLKEEDAVPKVISMHVKDCKVCRARKEYADKHAPPMPGGLGVVGRLLSVAERLPGVLRSAFYGFLIVLLFTGVGVLYLLGMGAFKGDSGMIGGAFALLAITASGGGAGGVTHYYTQRLREHTTIGHYFSWILVVYGYLLGVFGLVWILAGIIGREGLVREIPDMADLVVDPAGWVMLAVLGAVFGIALGWQTRDSDLALVGDPAAEADADESSRGLTLGRVGKGLIYLLLIGGAALRFFGGGESEPRTARDYERELPALEETAQANPGDAEAQYEFAHALATLDRHVEALQPFSRAVQLQPNNADFHNAYGWSLMQIGRYDGALSHFGRALQVDPDHEVALHNTGWALFSQGRYDESLHAYRQTLRLNPENAGAQRELGYTYVEVGRYEEAARAAREAVRLNPRDARAHGLLAWTLFQLKRYEEALPEAEEALRIDRQNPTHHETLGLVLIGMGRGDEALPSYREAVKLAPGDARLWRDLARLAHMLGQYQEAAEAYEEVDRLEPTYFDHMTQDRDMWEDARGKAGN